MGRHGGGGGRSSGGFHSHMGSRSHGSFHSSGSRGRSSFSSFTKPSRPASPPPPPRPPRPRRSWIPPVVYHTTVVTSSGGTSVHTAYRKRQSYTTALWIIIAVLIALCWLIACMPRGADIAPASTIPRERIETKNAYINDCIVDEIGWISNSTGLSKELQYFYEETGCQPFIYLKAYDPAMTDQTAQEEWIQNYYDTTFAQNQNVLLYVYFCDETNDGEGNSALWMGTESSVVMDSEAVEIFWAYLDYDWDNWDINDNDGMYADVFTKTADKIMHVTTTDNDVKKQVAIAITVIAVLAGGIITMVIMFKRKHQKAQETIDILNAPLESTADQETEDLADKYNGSDLK